MASLSYRYFQYPLWIVSLSSAADRRSLLSGAAASARGVLDDLVVGDQRADGTFAVLHELFWLTANLTADRPLLLAVDDVQWCDGASLRYLAYLAKRLEGFPIVLAMTLRTGEHSDGEGRSPSWCWNPTRRCCVHNRCRHTQRACSCRSGSASRRTRSSAPVTA